MDDHFYLLLDTETNYDATLDAFPKLHLNLTDTEISKYSQFESVVCDFVNQDRFKKSLPKSCLLESLTGCISQYKKEVQHFLSIGITRLAEGYELQRGAIFGFGKFADDETDKVLKISTLESSKRRKLNQAPVYNLNEERSVGRVNHEINTRGKKHLESVPKKTVINKSVNYSIRQISLSSKSISNRQLKLNKLKYNGQKK